MSTVRIRLVAGDAKAIRRTITDIPAGKVVAKAWFTVKAKVADADEDAVIQKIITAAPGADGTVEDAGSSGTAIVRFDLQFEDTAALVPEQRYVFDLQVLLDDGGPYTPLEGTLVAAAQVTQAET